MLTSKDLRGIVPALPTLVNGDDSLARDDMARLVGHVMAGGCTGVLPIGGTGEYGSLPHATRMEAVTVCAESCKPGQIVMAGVLDTGFHDAIRAGRDYAAAGANCLLILTPYYTNPTQAGLRDYFLRYADASPVPVLLYEIPYRTRVAIAPEITHELSRHPNIIGMKACNTDMYHFLQVAAGIGDDFTILGGEDSLFPLQMAAGAKGGIIVTASMLPAFWVRMHELLAAGDLAGALALHRQALPMMNAAFGETNPGPMKSVLDLFGIGAQKVLMPLEPCQPERSARLRAEVEKLLAA
ncbi:dihydrodipicolinate synthase family protein [Paracoccus siganidrum]|uniref:Dihydrodipicolinate synthase family protein n=1 Tax=Paracoccus siganidrum TaxID=1276757 RepID=A0A419AB55_9RHOB|nr:dihydrodipicolinate synthase family protein [Paracoccus siganidrum]RJL20589.1 dihydrodipicolinate synthase family protein [Paracoccus siganidrum]RMC38333.1 dihydrodipicolinate synthase family protein [Paracoccus siganidrum]